MSLTLYTIDGIGTLRCAEGGEMPGQTKHVQCQGLTPLPSPLPKGAFLEDLCYHAQQAAEKALKAVYRRNGWMFRYTHDLEN